MHENFFHKLKVYYEDTDSGGVVYYANYLKFLERARTEALVSIGFSNKKVKEQFNSLIIVKSCNIEYKKPAHLEDELNVRSFVKSVTKTSFFMNQIITKRDEIVVEAKNKDLDKVSLVVSNNMQNAVKLDVPLYVNTKLNTSLANFNN